MKDTTLFWFRRDLRLKDNAGLYYALKNHQHVQCMFIFDTTILDVIEDKQDARVHFIHQQIHLLKDELNSKGSDLQVFYGNPTTIFEQLFDDEKIEAVYCNHDYEPIAIQRDKAIKELCKKHSISFQSYKDQVIFEKDEILKDDGTPYSVFTPYSRKWKQKLNDFYLQSYPTESYFSKLSKDVQFKLPELSDMGFNKSQVTFPPRLVKKDIIKHYDETRNFPAIEGTTKLSVHLRFGTLSVRKLAQIALQLNEVYLNELIWRDFYMMILWHHPRVVHHAFKAKYDSINWQNDETHFKAWCEGKTGFPIVDAGMRELNKTGYMHNRVRMITASFLVKDLLIDWRWGEAYFAQKLLDFDLAANNGGWQWASGSGCDAAPYFRIFNPESQLKKFDKNLTYVKKWVPEFGTDQYPAPIVNHKEAREKTLAVYKHALSD